VWQLARCTPQAAFCDTGKLSDQAVCGAEFLGASKLLVAEGKIALQTRQRSRRKPFKRTPETKFHARQRHSV
jgi:hypothetical protein